MAPPLDHGAWRIRSPGPRAWAQGTPAGALPPRLPVCAKVCAALRSSRVAPSPPGRPAVGGPARRPPGPRWAPARSPTARGAPAPAAAAAAAAEFADDAPVTKRGPWALYSPWDAEIFRLAVPALFSMLLDPVMGVVDTAIVGRLGTEPLAAVGLSTVLYNFSNFIWNFLLYTTTPRIAAAASRDDRAGVSAITAQGLWVAAAIGVTMTVVLWTRCPALFAGMGASPGVLEHAVPYLRGRCIASPAILMFYVLAGTFRGFKDTMTPLTAGVVSNLVHLALDVALVFGLGWGVTGAALATSLSHWATLLVLLGAVMRKGYLRPADLARPPAWAEVAPMLRNGVLLSTRSLLAMSMLMWATKLVAGAGAAALAAHEILRQIWVFSNQTFTSLDIATQSLIAFYLGRGDRASAAAIFRRTLGLTLVAGVGVMCALLGAREALPGVFTRDAAVIAQVVVVLPLVAVFMPLDAAASAMDGVLLGSQQAAWLSRTMIVTAAFCSAGLAWGQHVGFGLLATWGVIKFLTVGRLIGNAWRIWSPESPLGPEFGRGGRDGSGGGGGGVSVAAAAGAGGNGSGGNGTSSSGGEGASKGAAAPATAAAEE